MINILGVQAPGEVGFAHSNPPAQTAQKIEPIGAAQNDGSAGSQLGGQSGHADYAQPQNAAAQTTDAAVSFAQGSSKGDVPFEPPVIVFSANMVTGPTPTFQVSLMDIGSELRNEIAMAQAKQTHIPDSPVEMSAPMIPEAVDEPMPVSSSDLSTPTERRDAQSVVPPQPEQAAEVQTDTSAQLAMPSVIQDPEAVYAGMAALQARPYEGINISA